MLQASALPARLSAPLRPRRRSARFVAAHASIKSVRQDALQGGTVRETFAVDLLGLGKQTEQVLQSTAPGAELVALSIARPMGCVFAERKTGLGVQSISLCVVDELLPGSNAAAAGVRVGDVLRLVTAVVSVRDKTDTLSYYTNPPKSRSRRALLVADGQPFSKMMKALLSNSEAVDMPTGETQVFDTVPIVLERTA